MARIGWVEGIGYCASLLVFCSFYMKTMIPLRSMAIASNLAFMTYGLAGGLYPVFFLHVVLLPLNCLRLHQMRVMVRKVREAAQGDLSVEWLIPLLTRRRLEQGDVLFRMGDPASSMHLILEGSVRLVEIGIVLGPSTLVGEIGVFSPDHRRTGTAVCETAVEIGPISGETVLQLYYQNPAFGFYLFRLVVQRMLETERRWRAQSGVAPP
jgi:CRP/FNR family transcriptional regulator, cyclic AMP receptor protein